MGSSPSRSPSPGEARSHEAIAGRYDLLRKLGSGSTGTVYLARDRVLDRDVALKAIHSERVTPGDVSSIQREFRALTVLRHPRIALAHDFGYTETGVPYYTREYVPGVPLEPGPPTGEDPAEYLSPVLDLLDALAYLHDHGVLHLDVHAGNLILSQDPSRGAVLIDFGLVRSPSTLRRSVCGSYGTGHPPEILRGDPPAPHTDVFLAGGVLHYRLTGRSPGKVELPPEIPGWGARLTLELERITAKALETDEARRFRSVRELRNALEQALGGARRPPLVAGPKDIIVGRDAEIRAIDHRLREAVEGIPGALCITGPSGRGKTRLLAEARVRAQLRGFDVVAVRGLDESARGAPVLAEAIERAKGLSGSRDIAWLDPLSARHGGTPATRAKLAADAYFFTEGRPSAILVDDLHALDRESRTLLQAFLARAALRRGKALRGRGLVVVTTSTDPPAPSVEKHDVLTLGPIGAGASLSLVRSLLSSIELPPSLTDDIASFAGEPLHLRQIASAILEEWRRFGSVPDRLDRLETLLPAIPGDLERASGFSLADRPTAAVLSVAGRPCRRSEITAALSGSDRRVRASLRRLREAEAIIVLGHGRDTRYRLHPGVNSGALAEGVSRRETARIHGALARLLERTASGPRDRENLARHLLAAGRRTDGCETALAAAPLLARQGSFDRAFRLLEEAFAAAPRRQKLRLAEALSSLAEEIGDHEAAVRLLRTFAATGLDRTSRRDAARVLRRLGVHYHRSGLSDEALAAFERARRFAAPGKNLEDLVFIDSELAEIHTFRGDYAAAEAACRSGLERLRRARSDSAFRGRMAVTLRASLGHLELRRMNLGEARHELGRALAESKRHGTTADRAAILMNLGVALNQENRFEAAKERFREAERLLLATGERQGTIRVACNLAVIHAKLSEAEEALAELEKAARLLRYYAPVARPGVAADDPGPGATIPARSRRSRPPGPKDEPRGPGRQLEFFVAYARGAAAYFLGDAIGTIEAFEKALPIGRELGDEHLVGYGEVYLADAHLASGRYREALRRLRSAALRATRRKETLLLRMVRARFYLIDALAGRPRARKRSRALLAKTPRSKVELLEAWNDLFAALGDTLSGHDARPFLESSGAVFRRLGIPAGEAFARLGGLVAALAGGDRRRVRGALREATPSSGSGHHRFLAVAEPLARAEAHMLLDEIERARPELEQASAAMVGAPFLELDLRIEVLRSRLALLDRDPTAARRHLHRAAKTRELLVGNLPRSRQKTPPSVRRFAALDEMESRLRPPREVRTPEMPTRRAGGYEELVGRSTPMVRVYELLERVAQQEMPVLISGETGTGKELAARAIHRRSLRALGPFFAVHCASLIGPIFETELFGVTAGAYTDATDDRPGLLEAFSGGTVLLDEIGELAPDSQVKLLRVLDSGTFRSVGSVEPRRADVRFLASTSADLARAAEAGRFRAELYYRLAAVEITLPPLRERRGDIAVLAGHLLERHAQKLGVRAPALSDEARELLEEAPWPGNVRELEITLLRALITSPGAERLGAGMLEAGRAAEPEETKLFDEELVDSLDLPELRRALERQYLTRVFFQCRGDPACMMKKLGVKRTRLYTWLRRLGIDPRELRKRL